MQNDNMLSIESASGVSAAGEATGRLIYDVLRLANRLTVAGDALLADLGVTSARWQILGTLGHADADLTVPQLAERLGQSRQAVQRIVNDLGAAGLVAFETNPAHKRSPFVRPTEAGRGLHATIEARRIPWTEDLAAGLDADDVAVARRLLAALGAKLGGDA
jgi:DNA-binding MarR family transcriptional regulator